MDGLGRVASRYRANLYAHGIQKGPTLIEASSLAEFCSLASKAILPTLQQAIQENHLAHSYTILHVTSEESIQIETLSLMLEGQIAALTSGMLGAADALALLNALEKSPLYSTRLGSYLLYADKNLPTFSARNRIAPNDIVRLTLVRKLIKKNDQRLIARTANGQHYFSPSLVNASELTNLLDLLREEGYESADRDRANILALYEKRSGMHPSRAGPDGSLSTKAWVVFTGILFPNCFWQYRVPSGMLWMQMHRIPCKRSLPGITIKSAIVWAELSHRASTALFRKIHIRILQVGAEHNNLG